MRKPAIVIFLSLVFGLKLSCSKSTESISDYKLISNANYTESIEKAKALNSDLEHYLNTKGNYLQKEEDEIVSDFISNYGRESINSLLSEYGMQQELIYEKSFNELDVNVEDINNLPITEIEKELLKNLFAAAENKSFTEVLNIVSKYKHDVSNNPQLNNWNFIIALIETSEQYRGFNKDRELFKDCTEAAETGGTIGGIYGMIKGAVVGGITGSVLGLNLGTGAAGAVVGGVGGGVLGYVEGAILGYLGCQIFG